LAATVKDLEGRTIERFSKDSGFLEVDVFGIWVDVWEFDKMRASELPEGWARALELGLRGRLLEDCGPKYRWAQRFRDRYQQHYLTTLERLAEHLGPARLHEIRSYVEFAVDQDPLRESVHRLWMEILLQDEKPDEALDVYQGLQARIKRRCCRSLEAETQKFEQTINAAVLQQREAERLQRARRMQPARNNLPLETERILGREDELARLENLLARPASVPPLLITLTGFGGTGKTRLAVAAAHAWYRKSGQALSVIFVDLAGLSDAEQIPGAIQRAIGTTYGPNGEGLRALAVALAREESLLVLVIFEDLLPVGLV
jgi:hypothetical protein